MKTSLFFMAISPNEFLYFLYCETLYQVTQAYIFLSRRNFFAKLSAIQKNSVILDLVNTVVTV